MLCMGELGLALALEYLMLLSSCFSRKIPTDLLFPAFSSFIQAGFLSPSSLLSSFESPEGLSGSLALSLTLLTSSILMTGSPQGMGEMGDSAGGRSSSGDNFKGSSSSLSSSSI